MVITREQTRVFLLQGLREIGQEAHFDLIVDLTWLACIIADFGYSCFPEHREVAKDELLEFLENPGGDALKAYRAFLKATSSSFIVGCAPSAEDLIVAEALAKLSPFVGMPTEAALATWIDRAWAYGVRQRRIFSGDEEGPIVNKAGTACNFASSLALFGSRDNLLPPPPSSPPPT